MVLAFWAAKGGQGTTTVAVQTAVQLARRPGPEVVLVDLAGGVPGFFSADLREARGVTDWMRAAARKPNVALPTHQVADRLLVVPNGWGTTSRFSALPFARKLAADGRRVVVDCGAGPSRPATAAAVVAEHSHRSVVVTRECLLALAEFSRRDLPPPSGVVVVREPGRLFGPADVAVLVGAPVLAEVPLDPTVARLTDAGRLAYSEPAALAGLAEGVIGEQSLPAMRAAETTLDRLAASPSGAAHEVLSL